MPRRLVILMLLASTGCAVGVAKAGESPTTISRAPLSPATTVETAPDRPIRTTTTTTTEEAHPVATPDRPGLSTDSLAPHFSLAARSDHALPVYARPLPIEPYLTLASTTILGTPRVVHVLEGPVDGWLRVALPVRPNGSEGWIKTDGLVLFAVETLVEVDLSERTLSVSDSTGTLLETSVAVGSSTSPTPTGSFFVTDSVITGDDYGPWGPWAFGLSARSDVITEFNGGDGIIGIHGTNRPGSIGSAASLGCVRVPNDVAIELGGLISAGVPVEIRP